MIRYSECKYIRMHVCRVDLFEGKRFLEKRSRMLRRSYFSFNGRRQPSQTFGLRATGEL